MSGRREVLAEQATDYVLEHGLIDLSLRPLAAALGTSDRMLLYHFQDKNDLVATVLNISNERSVQGIRELAPSRDVRQAVIDLWGAVSTPEQARCGRLYVEAAALGVLGAEPFASVVSGANQVWLQTLADHLVASGLRASDAGRAARLVEAAFMGFQLDETLEPPTQIRRSIGDLADAVAAVWAE
ncbi:MAG: TetR/AcrR family transcriptional regulator [Marmoricola sp.]